MPPLALPLEQIALLGLRALTGLVFVWSGFSHVRDAEGRSKDLGLPKPITLLVGVVELLAGLGVAGGLLTRLSAVGLMIVMLGAMHRKAFVWHSGFWGKNSMGWHYDLIFFLIALLIFATNGGEWTIDRMLFGARAAGSWVL
ncbi:MAG TPA: DoxX family protein [Thermoanaerobaculia bacterium]|jgi:putative oxidoreductase|nr:DoxX family protein [Thermoanaerobaculia bacterium]